MNHNNAINDNVKDEYKQNLFELKKMGISQMPMYFGKKCLSATNYHSGNAIYINEAGLYSLIMKSKVPLAEAFRSLNVVLFFHLSEKQVNLK